MHPAIAIPLLLVGLLLWAAAGVFWSRPATDHVMLRLGYLPAMLALFAGGYFCVFVGLGIDRWDDSSDWYWDTWLMFTSGTALAMGFAWVKFTGKVRVLLMALPVLALAQLVRFYLTA